MAGTNAGWIIVWSLLENEIMTRIRIKNPLNPKMLESIDMLKDMDLERFMIGYSKKTEHLFYLENRGNNVNESIV